MPQYKYIDLPAGKTDSGGTIRAEAITRELNALADQGWRVINALPSILLGKVGFALER